MDIGLNREKIVLVVDDLFENLVILKKMLEKCGYSPMTASSAKDALNLIKIKTPKLILLDVYMPEMDGFELCEILKSDVVTKDIPIVFISAGMSKEDKVKGFLLGAVDFINKPFELEEVSLRVNNHIQMYEMRKNMESNNKNLNKMVKDHAIKIKDEQKNTIISLEKLFFLHYPDDEKSFRNVARNCRFLSQALEFSDKYSKRISPSFIDAIEEAVLLHDIGRLAHRENDVIGHEYEGAKFLQELTFLSEHNELLKMATKAAKHHNEKWDGTGGPDNLKGEDIPVVARILAICNGYESAVKECFKTLPGVTQEEARVCAVQSVVEKRGTYYDPDIVDIFKQVSRQFTIVQ